MSTPKVSMVITTYFPEQELVQITRDCLDSLVDFGRPDQVVITVDGPKGAGVDMYDFDEWSTEHMRKGDNTVFIRENTGFAHAVNAGLAATTGEYIVISNNDIIFTPNWLEELVKPLNMGYDISSIRTSDQKTWTTEDKITEGDKFGSLWAMKRKVYEELGGLDERFGKGYFEDTDYRRRALDSGFKIAKNHAGFVEHLGRATFDRIDPERNLYEKNKEVYRKKWGQVD